MNTRVSGNTADICTSPQIRKFNVVFLISWNNKPNTAAYVLYNHSAIMWKSHCHFFSGVFTNNTAVTLYNEYRKTGE